MKHLFYYLFLFVLVSKVVAQEKPKLSNGKGSIGFGVGLSNPIGIYGTQKVNTDVYNARHSYAKVGAAYSLFYNTPAFGKQKRLFISCGFELENHAFNDGNLSTEFRNIYTNPFPFGLTVINNRLYKNYSFLAGIGYKYNFSDKLYLNTGFKIGAILSRLPDYETNIQYNGRHFYTNANGESKSGSAFDIIAHKSVNNKGIGGLVEIPIGLNYDFAKLPLSISFSAAYKLGLINIQSQQTLIATWSKYDEWGTLMDTGNLTLSKPLPYPQTSYSYSVLNFNFGISYRIK